MMWQEQTVVVVDDDHSVRDSLGLLFKSLRIPCRLFATGTAFLKELADIKHGCVLLDICMQGIGGLEMQQELNRRRSTLPKIFINGHADVSTAVKAMQHGAFDFVEKPFSEAALLERVQKAFAFELTHSQQAQVAAAAREQLGSLTKREKQVFDRVARGHSNKVVAAELGITEGTVEVHRARVMKKLAARTLADLVRIYLAAERPMLSNARPMGIP